MTRHGVLVAALFACLASGVLAQEPADDEPIVATDSSGAVRVTASEALEEMSALYGRGILDELIVAELVRQRAEATGALIPTEGEIELEYEQYLRNLIAMAGGSVTEREDLVAFSNVFEDYFSERAITPASVRRRIATRMTAERILERELKLTDEEIEAGFDSLMAELQGGEKRRVATYLVRPEDILDSDLEPGEDRKDAALRKARRVLEVISAPGFEPNFGDIRVYAPAQPGEEPGVFQELAFRVAAPGECLGPVETPEGYAVVKLLEVFAPGESLGTEGLTDAQKEALRAASQEYLRSTALKLLLQRKIHREIPAYLARLRDEGRVEVLWEPPLD